ncbi:hypothetical protein [Novosphingobium sp. fls2-241-R2A-195]|uniref:hypothetical protein n=1 Tax=Novosphingobium sp. fls2-241-R2A-195 TaxID=3040296 RepID=UPI00254FC130|nr:hypothetical protein [Novosphingobium sp. fls2-241-R2A-195]
MTDFSPALDAELAKDNVTIFGALTLDVGAHTIRLLDGSSHLLVNGNLYTGEDAKYGTWGSMESFEDGAGDEAPGLAVMLLPTDDDAAAALSGPSMQGEAVQIHIGAVNVATGAVIGEPFLLFDGEVDVTKHEFGKNMLQVSLECVGGMERLFFDDEGMRLAPAFHQQVWPGEQGLNHVTGTQDTIYWGSNTPTRQTGYITSTAMWIAAR